MNDDLGKSISSDQLSIILTKWSFEKRASTDHSCANDVTRKVEEPRVPSAPNNSEPLPAHAACLDPEIIGRMRKTHAALLERIVKTYAQHAPKTIAALDRAIASQNMGDLQTTAHSMKSSSAHVGALRLSIMCRDLESRLKSSSEWDAPANLAAVDAIKCEYTAVAKELAALDLELTASADAPSTAPSAR
jgi:two-component system sensor histidine kinase/response regulator